MSVAPKEKPSRWGGLVPGTPPKKTSKPRPHDLPPKVDIHLLEHPLLKERKDACGLSQRETELLAWLLANQGREWTYKDLMTVFGSQATVASILKRLREKIAKYRPHLAGLAAKKGNGSSAVLPNKDH